MNVDSFSQRVNCLGLIRKKNHIISRVRRIRGRRMFETSVFESSRQQILAQVGSSKSWHSNTRKQYLIKSYNSQLVYYVLFLSILQGAIGLKIDFSHVPSENVGKMTSDGHCCVYEHHKICFVKTPSKYSFGYGGGEGGRCGFRRFPHLEVVYCTIKQKKMSIHKIYTSIFVDARAALQS